MTSYDTYPKINEKFQIIFLAQGYIRVLRINRHPISVFF